MATSIISASTNKARLSALLFISLFLILASSSLSTATKGTSHEISASQYRSLLGLQQRSASRRQIPNCSEMVSRSQCSQNPTCRWCRSDALDDMCFSKTEAWRLPRQVFLCE